MLLALTAAALAVDITVESERTPHPGVTVQELRLRNPSTDAWVARIDLCASGVHVDATQAPSGLESTGSWASGEGLQLASNGDFYKSSPTRVYGDAVGNGQRWPLEQTGLDPGYSWEWFYLQHGWIAFGHDAVTFTHTEWVKDNVAGLGAGWRPDEVAPDPPAGTLALVSGFPELVIEGEVVTCDDPSSTSCFPDRSDMADRHPRTAMGLTEDLQTFLLVVVDGRTSDDSGVYGAELADLMGQLGAWEAFNLDGGGSSQLWLDGSYLNDVSGNNSGGGTRSVGNHWGVAAGSSSGWPSRPGHCLTREPCATLPAAGGTLDDDGACFQTFGPQAWWRTESAGHGGGLHWTNAWKTDQPSNWAWWRIELVEAGTYQVEWFAEPDYAVFDTTRYSVHADGQDHELTVDQSTANGWAVLGTWDFAAGGDQWVAVHDDADGSVASDQHVVADAIRLTRIGGWCGDGTCDGDEDSESCPTDCPPEVVDTDTASTTETGTADDTAGTGETGDGQATPWDRVPRPEGRSCGAAPAAAVGWLALLAVLAAATRRSTGRPGSRT